MESLSTYGPTATEQTQSVSPRCFLLSEQIGAHWDAQQTEEGLQCNLLSQTNYKEIECGSFGTLCRSDVL